jgi:hypothetical protein
MSSELYSKIYKFLVNAKQEHITATSVIYKGIEEDPWIQKEELRGVVHQAISSAMNLYPQGSEQHQKFLGIPLQVSPYETSLKKNSVDRMMICRSFSAS